MSSTTMGMILFMVMFTAGVLFLVYGVVQDVTWYVDQLLIEQEGVFPCGM